MTGLDDRRLDALRQVGDPEADDLAAELCQRYPDMDERDLVRHVLDQIAWDTETTDDAVAAWLDDGPAWPSWARHDQVLLGQRFFDRWPLPIASALFCVSLPASYAAATGTQVLSMTSDLATRNLRRRIAETGQMLFDVMGDPSDAAGALEPNGQGYVTIRGIRLLHAVVRRTLLATMAARPSHLAALNPSDDPTKPLCWRVEWGMPVNQEDLLGTLLSFSVAVFQGLDRLGIPYEDEAADAYLHTWCLIGHLLGIQPDLLPLDRKQAEVLVGQITRRHHHPSPAGTRLTAALVQELELAMPFGLRKLPRTLMWRMLPSDVARMLDIPAAAWWRPALGLMATTGRPLGQLPGCRRLIQVPTALLGRAMLRMLIERELNGRQPAFRLDAAVAKRLAITTGPVRQTLRCRRRRLRVDRRDGAGSS